MMKSTFRISDLGFSQLFTILVVLFADGAISPADAQNRCPPGQREITNFGMPSKGPPTCTSDLPKGTVEPVRCPKNLPLPPTRFLPGVNVKMGAQIPGEKGHRYVDVGPGKFARLYYGCFNKNVFIKIHNGERVEVKSTIRGRVGDLGRACHNNRCGMIFLADLRPLNARQVPGRRADEDAGNIDGLDEKFYVAIPRNKRLILYSKPDQFGDVLAELLPGTSVKGSKKNLKGKPLWKRICTNQKCGYVVARYLKHGNPQAIDSQDKKRKRTMKISALRIDVYPIPDSFSKKLGTVYHGQIVDVYESRINEEGVRWTKICTNGCGWVITEDLK